MNNKNFTLERVIFSSLNGCYLSLLSTLANKIGTVPRYILHFCDFRKRKVDFENEKTRHDLHF